MQVSAGTVTRGEVGGIQASTLLLDEQGREVRIGDRLVPVDAQPYDLQFIPHPPRQQIEYGRARILAVADMLSAGGPRDVVALSVGAREGVDNGTVFSIWRVGSNAVDKVEYGAERTRGHHSAQQQGAPARRIRRPRDGVPHLRQGELRTGDGQHQAQPRRLRAEASGRAVLSDRTGCRDGNS